MYWITPEVPAQVIPGQWHTQSRTSLPASSFKFMFVKDSFSLDAGVIESLEYMFCVRSGFCNPHVQSCRSLAGCEFRRNGYVSFCTTESFFINYSQEVTRLVGDQGDTSGCCCHGCWTLTMHGGDVADPEHSATLGRASKEQQLPPLCPVRWSYIWPWNSLGLPCIKSRGSPGDMTLTEQ